MKRLDAGAPRKLTEIEWQALRATGLCGCGRIPLTQELWEILGEKAIGTDVSVLSNSCMYSPKDSCFVLLARSLADRAEENTSPTFLGVYVAERYKGPDVTFERLYNDGLVELRKAERNYVWQSMFLCFIAAGFIVTAATNDIGFSLIAAACCSVIGGAILYWSRMKKVPKPGLQLA